MNTREEKPESSVQAADLEEKKSDSSPNPIPLYLTNFNALIAERNYIVKTASEFHKNSVHKNKISDGLRALRRAELLTRENQAAILVAGEHALAVAYALEVLDDASIILSNEIRLALVKAGKDAQKVVDVLKFLNAEGIINIKQPSLFSRASCALPYTERFLSLHIDELQKLKKTISTTLTRADNNKPNVVRCLRMLNEREILLTEEIVIAIESAGQHSSQVTDALIKLNNANIPLANERCKAIARAGFDAHRLAEPFIILHTADISLTDAIVTAIVNAGNFQIVVAKAYAAFKAAGLPLTDGAIAALADIQNHDLDKIIEVLLILKEQQIELTGIIISSVISQFPPHANPVKTAKDIAATFVSLHVAKVPLTEKTLQEQKIQGGYSSLSSFDCLTLYSYYDPSVANTLLSLIPHKIEITDEIIDLLTAGTYWRQHAQEMVNIIISLHEAGIPLNKRMLESAMHVESTADFHPKLPRYLITLKNTHGALLTDEFFNAVAAAPRHNARNVAEILLSLLLTKLLTNNILTLFVKNKCRGLQQVADALLLLNTHKISLNDEAQKAIIESGSASNVAIALIQLKSIKIQLSNDSIIAIANIGGYAGIIANALASLSEAKVSLTDKIIGCVIKGGYHALNVAIGLIALKNVRFPLVDDTVNYVSLNLGSGSGSGSGSDVGHTVFRCITHDDIENRATVLLFLVLIHSLQNCVMLPMDLISLVCNYFAPTSAEEISKGVTIQTASFISISNEVPECPAVTTGLSNNVNLSRLSEENLETKTDSFGNIQYGFAPIEPELKNTGVRSPGFSLVLMKRQIFFPAPLPSRHQEVELLSVIKSTNPSSPPLRRH